MAEKTVAELLQEQNELLCKQNELLEEANSRPVYSGPSDVEMAEIRARRWDAQQGFWGRAMWQNPHRR